VITLDSTVNAKRSTASQISLPHTFISITSNSRALSAKSYFESSQIYKPGNDLSETLEQERGEDCAERMSSAECSLALLRRVIISNAQP
jgi:hypothetical protein